MQRINIVGGSGFIGTELIHQLSAEKHTVLNIDKTAKGSPFEEITKEGNICNPADLEQCLSTSDWVVLLAAEHKDDVTPKSLYYEVNVEGTRNVLQEMDRKGIKRIIFTSSVAVYGLNKENPSESSSPDPFNDYGISKWQAEEVLREWQLQDPQERTLIIIRPTVVFGPGNKGNVYNLLRQIATGKFLMIGKGLNKKSMAFVENIAAFIKYLIDNKYSGYHVYNYADKPDLSMNDLVATAEKALAKKLPSIRIPYWLGYSAGLGFDLIAAVSGKKLPISAVRVKKFCATTQFANDAMLASGYSPKVSLQEGLSKTLIAIVRENS